jgi:hypothetical protein
MIDSCRTSIALLSHKGLLLIRRHEGMRNPRAGSSGTGKGTKQTREGMSVAGPVCDQVALFAGTGCTTIEIHIII